MQDPADLGRLDSGAWKRVQELADRFAAAWQHAETVDLASYLPPEGDPLRAAALVELLKTDLEMRWQRNQVVGLEEYVQRFPELGSAQTVPVQLIYEEFRVRHRFGDQPQLSSYKQRFPDQQTELERLVRDHPVTATARDGAPPAPPVNTLLAAGQMLHLGREFKLLKRLGSGAFGEVWEAENPGGFRVAIKVILRPIEDAEAQLELRSLTQIRELNHPFLIQTQDYYICNGRLFIIMDLADGTLLDRLQECRDAGLPGIEAQELLGYFREVADAVDYMHGAHVLHRDLKPRNLMRHKGHAKVGDFTLARLMRSQQTLMSATGLGTAPYMAPETWQSQACEQSDQYSLAVCYVELRLDRLPFDRPNLFELMLAHTTGKPNLEGLPPPEQAVLRKALSKEPAQRYQSCRALVLALEQAVEAAGPEANLKQLPVRKQPPKERGKYESIVIDKTPVEPPCPPAEEYDDTFVPPVDPNWKEGPKAPRSRWRWGAAVGVFILLGLALAWFLRRPSPEQFKPPVVDGLLGITSEPPDAKVAIDDREQQALTGGQFQVPQGEHTIRVWKSGYKPEQRTVRVQAGQEQQLDPFKLVPEPPAETFTLLAPEQLVLTAGEAKRLTVQVRRTGFAGPITLAFTERPDGVELPSSAGIADGKDSTQIEVRARREAHAPGGRVTVRAEGGGQSQSVGFPLVLTELPPGEVRALLVGVVNKDGRELPEFVHADADVVGLARVLAAGGANPKNLVVLTDTAPLPVASLENIRGQFASLVGRCKPNDSLVIALIGPVIQPPTGDEAYFCPAGARREDVQTLLPLRELYEKVASAPAECKVVLADVCRGMPLRTRGSPPAGLAVLWSCADGEKGYHDLEERHGVFCHCLLRGLEGGADADNNGKVTLAELAAYVAPQVARLVREQDDAKQTPQLVGSTAPGVLTDTGRGLLAAHRGTEALEAKQWARAVEEFRQAVQKNDTFLEAYVGLGLACWERERYDEAIKACDQALKLDKQDPVALSLRADAFYKKGDNAKALADYLMAQKDDPQFAGNQLSLAVYYGDQQENDKALECYTKALALNPRSKDAYCGRGRIYTRLGVKDRTKYEQALQDLTKALRLDPEFADAYHARALVYHGLADFGQALADHKEAIARAPQSASFIYARGLTYFTMQDYREALVDFGRAIELDQQKPVYYFYRASAYRLRGEYDAAIKDFNEALKRKPGYKQAQDALKQTIQEKANPGAASDVLSPDK
jgi:serine/threonine protein kinase/tetratricopeptide (TPR) repeat protein